MTTVQWETLLKIIAGKKPEKPPVGFIIDSPWLPGWYGIRILDYYSSDEIWFNANLEAIKTFPDVIFLPGFWAEYGMCTEPSAFGSKIIWSEQSLPHAEKIINSCLEPDQIRKPDVKSDGLLPFVINRLYHSEERIKAAGHRIKFAVSRGPLNIASFLMGTTEFMMGITSEPEKIHRMLSVITDFIQEWIGYQMDSFRDIDGIFLLDDMVGFVGEKEFESFVLPYLKKVYDGFNVPVKFFHNDAHGLVCAPYLKEIGINLFNFSFEHSIQEMRDLAGKSVVLLGNIPPRDILAQGTADVVKKDVHSAIQSLDDHSRVIWSCGGGMPQDVPTENIQTFVEAANEAFGTSEGEVT